MRYLENSRSSSRDWTKIALQQCCTCTKWRSMKRFCLEFPIRMLLHVTFLMIPSVTLQRFSQTIVLFLAMLKILFVKNNLLKSAFQCTYVTKKIYLHWILILLILIKEVENWTLCQRQLSVVYDQLLLKRNPVVQNILIKYTKRYVILANCVKKVTLPNRL